MLDHTELAPDDILDYRDLFANAPIAYQSLDIDGCFLAVNEKWLETLQYTRSQVIDRWFGEFLSPRCRELFNSRFPCFKDLGVVSGVEFEFRRGDGQYRLLSFDGRIGRNRDGSFRRTHCVFKDITEERLREDDLGRALLQAEAANAAKSLFLANMSHELRTPLNAILGFSEMMGAKLKGPLSEAYAEDARIIHDSGLHLLRIINDVLDMSRIEAGAMTLDREEVDIGHLLDETLEFVRLQAARNEVRIVCQYSNHHLSVDRLRLKQAVLNILSNAIKFAKGGTVTIRTACTPPRHAIVISDTGPGMSADEIRQALVPFGRPAGDLLVRKHEGIGLGLPLAKHFVELHGGTLTVASSEGAGTTVTIALSDDAPWGAAQHPAAAS